MDNIEQPNPNQRFRWSLSDLFDFLLWIGICWAGLEFKNFEPVIIGWILFIIGVLGTLIKGGTFFISQRILILLEGLDYLILTLLCGIVFVISFINNGDVTLIFGVATVFTILASTMTLRNYLGKENVLISLKNIQIEFYFVWVFVNIVGILIGGFIGILYLFFMISSEASEASAFLEIFLMLLLFGLIFGTAQWLVLRKKLNNTKQWIPLTILGTEIGVAAIFFLSKLPASALSILPLYIFGSIFGFSLGAAQWFHLKRYAKQAGFWVLISVIGATAGILVHPYDPCCVDSPFGILLLVGRYAFIYAGVYAVITGAFLASTTALRDVGSTDNTLSNITDINNSTL